MASAPTNSADAFVRLPQVIQRTGLSKATIRRKELKGEFPRRQKISANVVAWYESDLQRWLRSPMCWNG
ncbi:helix-turn-helix transcriptional regulator [Sphingomonas sp. OTU376]|uniref:helix-turn-helix transcriptional regulator n=1 Tax=Sphingomonas sp. OTU376 TaxID=3043863 RepID=UPI00313DCDDA